jgi:hypothetical protein
MSERSLGNPCYSHPSVICPLLLALLVELARASLAVLQAVREMVAAVIRQKLESGLLYAQAISAVCRVTTYAAADYDL